MSTETKYTETQIDEAATAIHEASWGGLGGGFLVFDAHSLTGGAYYSRGSRPDLNGCIAVDIPSASQTIDEARWCVLDAIVDYEDDVAARGRALTREGTKFSIVGTPGECADSCECEYCRSRYDAAYTDRGA